MNRTLLDMRKCLMWVVLFASFPLGMKAQTVSVEEAQKIAADFFTKNQPQPSKPHKAMGKVEPVLAYTAKTQETPDFYVFNQGDSQGGFVMVGGNARQPEILGYSTTGTFDMERVPDNFRWWMEECQRMGAAKRNVPQKYRQSVEPFIATVWGQHEPFNSVIPTLGPQYKTFVTGCTATATAQVMNYYKYPKRGKGSKSYSILYNGTIEKTFDADFGNTWYDWDNMIEDYTNGCTQAQADAVGTLMYHIGVSVEMKYSSGGSSANFTDAGIALMEYFGYDKSMEKAVREHFTDEEWEKMIYQELREGRPILYSAFTSSNGSGGHGFILHGYDANTGLYAVNWGWEGYCDGYFTLLGSNPLKPAPNESAYKYEHSIYFNIKPDEGGEPVPIISTKDKVLMATSASGTAIRNYSLNRSTDTDVNLYVQFTAFNDGLSETSFSYGVMMKNQDNGFTVYPSEAAGEQELPAGYYYTRHRTVTINTSSLPYNGVYEIWPAFSVDNGITWKPMRTKVADGVPTVTVTGGEEMAKTMFTLTYMIGDEVYETYQLKQGESITPESEPALEGYTFSGWKNEPATMPANDVTVTGSFTVNSYTLTYMVDDEVYKTYTVEFGATVEEEAAPEKDGYIFSGWSETLDTMPARDVTITGSFTFVDGIAGVSMDGKTDGIYTLDGRKIEKLQKGVNIIRTSDGNVKKIYVK